MRETHTSGIVDLIAPPSIGSKDLTFDHRGNRVRQINSETEVRTVLQAAKQFGSDNGSTRHIVRVLMDPKLQITEHANGFRQEAVVPLAGRFEALSLFYYAMNGLERQSGNSVVHEENLILRSILDRQQKDPSEILGRMRGFRLERLQGDLLAKDIQRLAEMYAHSFTDYPFDIVGSIESMAKNGDYVVYVARSHQDNMPYAVCVTEQMTLDIPGFGKLVMREMGDSAKMPGVNGLNAPLKLMLINKAYQDKVDLVFCESRAALPQVNAINHDIGMEHCGFLNQHTRIGGEGINEGSIYGNMRVWSVNSDKINQIGARVESLKL